MQSHWESRVKSYPMSHTSSFVNKVAIVSGGSSGIGQAIALALAREGAKVGWTSLPADVAEGEEAFAKAGLECVSLGGDMGDESFCESTVATMVERFGRVDLLVNNAFSFIAVGTDGTREQWKRSFDVGLFAYAKMTQLVQESMRTNGGGAIVNVTSISGVIAQPNRWTYNAGKGAVNQLTRCAALDLAPMGIRVNSVSPGWIWTRENDKAAGYDRAKYDKIWGDFCMLRRMGKTEEVASAVLFLLSDAASFITGTDLPVDGGYQGLGPEGLGQNTRIAGTS